MIQRSLQLQIRKANQIPRLFLSQPTLLRRQTSRPLPTYRFPQSRIARFYSSDVETRQAGNAESTASDTQALGENEEEDPSTKELESKNREIIDLKDRYLRSVADFRNLQDRTKRDIQQARDFALSRFARDLLESVDNLDRALSTVPPEVLDKEDSDKDLKALYDGLKMTDTILMQTLNKHGLERFDPSVEKETFDPNLHEATFQAPMEGMEDGTVFMTQQKGFSLNGRVIRAAKVGVVKNP
ncbi:MAG: hypothetical protein LQ351_001798 [Letrouitia transgressa]|nr:MAG: hypothetical protein LQ351_001798 [Letrouitia transgressa]